MTSDANTRNVCSCQNYPILTTLHNNVQNLIYFILTLLTLFLGSLHNIKGQKEFTTEEEWYYVLECQICYLLFICMVHRHSRSSSSFSVLIVHLSTPPPVPQSLSPLLCYIHSPFFLSNQIIQHLSPCIKLHSPPKINSAQFSQLSSLSTHPN